MNDASTAKPLQSIDHVREQFHNLHEFVAVARARLDRNVWDYLIGGAETETTLRRNRQAIDSLAFRPRVLRDVNGTDTSSKFLGRKIAMPVALAPIGSIERFDPAAWAGVVAVYRRSGVTMQVRPRPDVERFFAGLDLIDPGVVSLPQWRPDPSDVGSPPSDAAVSVYGGVARKP